MGLIEAGYIKEGLNRVGEGLTSIANALKYLADKLADKGA